MIEDDRAAGASRRRALETRITETASKQHGVVTHAQLRAMGLSRGAIDRRACDGRLRRLHAGVFGIGPYPLPRESVMAAVLACGERAALSHTTAAALLGLVPEAGTPIEISVPLPFDRARPGLRVHRVASLAADETTVVDHIRVTTPTRTLADLASSLNARDLERVIARAERDGMVRADEIDAMRARYSGRRGASRLFQVIGRIDGPRFTRSEAEARFLRLVRRARLPAPRTNVTFGGFEIDFLWPEHNLAIEVDGFRYHGSRASFESDRRRAAQLASLGVQVIPLTWRQIVEDELATAAQVAQALALRR